MKKQAKRYFLVLAGLLGFSSMFLFFGVVPFIVAFLILGGALTGLYFLCEWHTKYVKKVNSEFELAMMKEGKKVYWLSEKESYNLLKYGVGFPENKSQKPIFLKELHTWQSKK